MHENVSAKRGSERVADLTYRPLNQLIVRSNFPLVGVANELYADHGKHVMMKEVEIARRVFFRQASVRYGLLVREAGTTKEDVNPMDPDTSESLLSGLIEPDELPIFPIMGALCNPLMQCHERMVTAGICTAAQAEHGIEELKRRIAGYHELRDNRGEDSTIEERIWKGNE